MHTSLSYEYQSSLCHTNINRVSFVNMKKELVLLFAVLLCCAESYSVEQLYRSLNVTCFEEADLKRICNSQVAILMFFLAKPYRFSFI